MEKISIIVPVYNTSPYLEKCLDSLVNQTYKNIEIICVNDGSTDNSAEILHRYSDTYSNVIAIDQENQGVSAARNTALAKANGDYLMFVLSNVRFHGYVVSLSAWLRPSLYILAACTLLLIAIHVIKHHTHWLDSDAARD